MKKIYTLDELNEMVKRANKKGGNLDLSGLTSIPEGFNPTVGGWLDLSGLTSIPEGFNPTVGGNLDLRGLTSNYKRLENGMYVPGEYIYCDNILTHIKSEHKKGIYTYYVGKIPGVNVVFDGENYAHCDSFKTGVCELEFKKAKDRGAEQYSNLTLDSVLTLEEATTAYRIITGACKVGTEHFINSLGDNIKDKYTVREMIEVTVGQYGSAVFKEFFKGKE